jgi:hypothetical protein
MDILLPGVKADASFRQEIETEGFDCGGTLERDPPPCDTERLGGFGSMSLLWVVPV